MKRHGLGMLFLSLGLVGCAHPQASPADQKGASPTTQAQSATPPIELNQTSVTLWFQQRGLETHNLLILSQPEKAGSSSGLPIRIQFKTAVPAGNQEKWRLELRTELSAWLVENGHPEGQCTSVDLKPDKDQLAVDIQIVCR